MQPRCIVLLDDEARILCRAHNSSARLGGLLEVALGAIFGKLLRRHASTVENGVRPSGLTPKLNAAFQPAFPTSLLQPASARRRSPAVRGRSPAAQPSKIAAACASSADRGMPRRPRRRETLSDRE